MRGRDRTERQYLGLTNFARTFGDRVTRLDRIEPELNSAISGDERDTTTPAAICSDMRRLLLGNVLLEASRRQLEDWLQRNETGGPMIRAGVPKNWIIGDKTGAGQTARRTILPSCVRLVVRRFSWPFTL